MLLVLVIIHQYLLNKYILSIHSLLKAVFFPSPRSGFPVLTVVDHDGAEKGLKDTIYC